MTAPADRSPTAAARRVVTVVGNEIEAWLFRGANPLVGSREDRADGESSSALVPALDQTRKSASDTAWGLSAAYSGRCELRSVPPISGRRPQIGLLCADGSQPRLCWPYQWERKINYPGGARD